ncbi:MAG: hypothetical protein BWY89_01356 [Bacteroidetes bacterium ADurb.BinA012]|nr:MAG: hypothetical protein BWY89_01356 [Bacteroidetes bacterium ADurb.BinA012]
MRGLEYPVDNGITHVQVGRSHINPGSQHTAALLKFTLVHPVEQVEVLLNAAVTVRTFSAGLGRGTLLLRDGLGTLVIHIGEAAINQQYSKIPQLAKIVRSVVFPVFPGKSKPLDIFLDGINILHLLFGGVGVIKPQVTLSAILFGHAEVKADRLCMPDMEVTIRLGREAGMNTAIVLPFTQVFLNELLYEMLRFRFCYLFRLFHLLF